MSIDPLMESFSEREKNDEHPSGSGVSQWTSQHQRHPNSLTFHQIADDSTQHLEEKARKAALKLQQNVYKTKGTHENIKHTFFLNKILEMTLALLRSTKGRESSESTQVRQCHLLVKTT